MLGRFLPRSKPALAADERATGTFVLLMWHGGADVSFRQQKSAHSWLVGAAGHGLPQCRLGPVTRFASFSQVLVVLTEALHQDDQS
jgi:hypothetical protein